MKTKKQKPLNLSEHFKGIQTLSNGRKMCLCPFDDHNDTIPSFIIYPDGFYHCYGCSRLGKLEDLFEDGYKYTGTNAIDVTKIPTRKANMLKMRESIDKKVKKLTSTLSKDIIYRIYDELDLLFVREGMDVTSSKVESILNIKREARKIIERNTNGTDKTKEEV